VTSSKFYFKETQINLLITGGTGFIGSALCSRLLEEKHHIVVLSRHPETIKAPAQGIYELECRL